MTHAIDFVHLADRVIIMKKGKIFAQGTYEELQDNEYMKEVMDIHKSHEKETKDIAKDAEKTEEKEESDEFDLDIDSPTIEAEKVKVDLDLAELPVLSDEELDQNSRSSRARRTIPNMLKTLRMLELFSKTKRKNTSP